MIPLLSSKEARFIDEDAEVRLGVPKAVLMENAGAGAARHLIACAGERVRSALILGGVGQNGGDAWVVARHLFTAGWKPTCFVAGDRETIRGEARQNFASLQTLVGSVQDARDLSRFEEALRDCDVVVDGLFGTGLARPIEGVYAQILDRIEMRGVPVFSLDLPSGIDADTGQILARAIRARWTATFGAPKRGLHQYPGAAHAGEIFVVPLGVPCTHASAQLLEDGDVATWVRPRTGDAHKGTGGHIAIVAGSPGKTGAALLAARGAFRAGAGLVTIAPRPEARDAIDTRVLECMTERLDVAQIAQGKQAMVLGPGLGTDAQGAEIARSLAVSAPIPTVIDADALSALCGHLTDLQRAAAPRILTPHPGEAARLLGCTSAEVQADRYAVAATLAQRSGHVVVLKGACSIVASPDGLLRVSARGTSALGVAGTGDVLAGAVGALLVVLPAFDAASCAVFLHAVAGEIAAVADRGLLASEVADALPRALTTTWQNANADPRQPGNAISRPGAKIA